MIIRLLTLCALALSSAAPQDGAQQPPAVGAQAAPASGDAAVDDEAARILERAARFQRGDQRADARAAAFHGRFYVTVRKPDDGGTVSLEVERSWTREPERILTRRRDPVLDSDTSVGFDGEVAWFQDHRTGEVLHYTDDPVAFEADLTLLRQDLRLTRLLLDAALLDTLVPRLRDVRVVGRAELPDLDGERHAVTELSAVVDDELFGPDPDAPPPAPGAPPPRLRLRLAVDDATGALRRVRLASMDRAQPRSMELRVLAHAPSTQGLQVPAAVELFEDGRETLSFGVVGDESGALVFEVDPELEAERFAPPAE